MKPSCPTTHLLLLLAVLFAGCATVPKEDQSVTPPDEDASSIDPYENVNRRLYDFTETVDRNILAPVANTYIDYVPNPVRNSIGNFYDNLGYPNVILNSFLQGKMIQGVEDTLRFVFNTTIGLAGIFDVATPMGLKKHDEDFGQTLGVWGVDNTSYMYLPILGPSSNRDVLGLPVTIASNVLFIAGFVIGAPITVPLGILGAIDTRARHAEDMHLRDQAALDPYLFTREAYWQQRQNLVFDGKPPIQTYDDLFEDELLFTSNPKTSQDTEPCLGTPVQHKFTTQQTWHPPLILEENDNKQPQFGSHNEKDCSLFAYKAKKRDQNVPGKIGAAHHDSEGELRPEYTQPSTLDKN